MSDGLTKYDTAEYISDDADIAALLEVAIEERDPEFLADSIGAAARALGMAELAKRLGIPRQELFELVNAAVPPPDLSALEAVAHRLIDQATKSNAA